MSRLPFGGFAWWETRRPQASREGRGGRSIGLWSRGLDSLSFVLIARTPIARTGSRDPANEAISHQTAAPRGSQETQRGPTCDPGRLLHGTWRSHGHRAGGAPVLPAPVIGTRQLRAPAGTDLRGTGFPDRAGLERDAPRLGHRAAGRLPGPSRERPRHPGPERDPGRPGALRHRERRRHVPAHRKPAAPLHRAQGPPDPGPRGEGRIADAGVRTLGRRCRRPAASGGGTGADLARSRDVQARHRRSPGSSAPCSGSWSVGQAS